MALLCLKIIIQIPITITWAPRRGFRQWNIVLKWSSRLFPLRWNILIKLNRPDKRFSKWFSNGFQSLIDILLVGKLEFHCNIRQILGIHLETRSSISQSFCSFHLFLNKRRSFYWLNSCFADILRSVNKPNSDSFR